MSRRILCLLCVVWMLLAVTGLPQVIGSVAVHQIAATYFLVLLALQALPLLMTHHGTYGHRLHPVNVFYGAMALAGIVGTLLLALAFGIGGGPGLTIIAGALLFTGVVGSAVLAFFATPWRDWTFPQREREYLARFGGPDRRR
ncbi:hypothetical protein [Corynebacterium heidelbergense]|uniref:Uncharacterized protein n=1 Tax=Corynebacterium heidelbergense TaxID=2055947 RepID=A0A364V601_9CORY|nr:hypothetical protein [Corynebacterium heidelbergense]RAV32072.1 hypothetical protein DLJ54_05105 [Corynebacterium heidelbergense]